MTTLEFTMQNRPECTGLYACAEAALAILKSGHSATLSVAVGEWKASIRLSAQEIRYNDRRDIKYEARIEDSSGYAAADYFVRSDVSWPPFDQTSMMLLVKQAVREFVDKRREMFRIACGVLETEE